MTNIPPTSLLSLSRSTAAASTASPVPSYTFLTPYRISTPRQPAFLKQTVSRFSDFFYLPVKCLSANNVLSQGRDTEIHHSISLVPGKDVQKSTFKQIPDYPSEAENQSLEMYI